MMNLTCPDCKEEMVRHRYETEEGDWTFGWLCGCNEETRKNRQSVSKSKLSGGLVALHKLSNKWREDANDRTAPPQDECDLMHHESAETYLECADELDRVIKEISN